VDKVGGVRPSDVDRIDIDSVRIGSQTVAAAMSQEHFARGDYFDLDEDEKLTSPSFERFDAGVRFGTDAYQAPAAIAFEPDVETAYLEAPDVIEILRLPGDFLVGQAYFGAVGRGGAAHEARLKDAPGLSMSLRPSPYAAVRTSDFGTGLSTAATTYSGAVQARLQDPGRLIVVEAAELVP
jgi:hypothetical protein